VPGKKPGTAREDENHFFYGKFVGKRLVATWWGNWKSVQEQSSEEIAIKTKKRREKRGVGTLTKLIGGEIKKCTLKKRVIRKRGKNKRHGTKGLTI